MTGYDAHGNFLPPQQLVDEIERLRAEVGNKYREGYENALAEQPFDRAAVIEECAKEIEKWTHGITIDGAIAAIRALKDTRP